MKLLKIGVLGNGLLLVFSLNHQQCFHLVKTPGTNENMSSSEIDSL